MPGTDSYWLTTITDGHVSNVWRHQLNVFNVWCHWWRHNGDHNRSYCNATIVMQGLCTSAPGFPSDVGALNSRPLLLDLDPKFHMSDTLRRHFHARRLVPGSPQRSTGCNQLARRYVPLCHDAWPWSTRFELNVCFALFCVCPGPEWTRHLVIVILSYTASSLMP